MSKITTVDQYIQSFEGIAQERLKILRTLVKDLVPNSVESISYEMPAYKLMGKPLIYFAAYDRHIGVYATPQAHDEFKEELSCYKQGKGSVQFPLDQELPIELIKKMIQFKKEMLETKKG